MATKSITVIDARVAELYDLEAHLALLQAKRKALADAIIAEGEGTYVENDLPDARKVVVIVPTGVSTKYDLYNPKALKAFLEERKAKKATPALSKEFRAAQEAKAREILGDHFGTCFDRVVFYVPAKGYADMIPRLFKTAVATAKKALLLCQIVTPPKEPHIKLPDKPKAPELEEEEA